MQKLQTWIYLIYINECTGILMKESNRYKLNWGCNKQKMHPFSGHDI